MIRRQFLEVDFAAWAVLCTFLRISYIHHRLFVFDIFLPQQLLVLLTLALLELLELLNLVLVLFSDVFYQGLVGLCDVTLFSLLDLILDTEFLLVLLGNLFNLALVFVDLVVLIPDLCN